ncbi:hypothetical protein EH32_02395 [Erythrobacter litoralis]|uniref:Uncharacterized protein n=1 Tax=Erythrobacter litoralis TaxID=39960 RepID=A0A074MYJ9_9SPHN|nr:hypothetical protein EH32_02395 [Erythrobacter litoralis]
MFVFRHWRQGAGYAAIPIWVPWQTRVPIYSSQLKCDPIGSNITLFEDMHWNLKVFTYFRGRQMMRPAVAKKDDVRDLFLTNHGPQGVRPFFE